MAEIRKDALYQEYTELSQELRGINPNLSICIGIKKRMEEIKVILDGRLIGAKTKKTRTKSGKYIHPHQYVHG